MPREAVGVDPREERLYALVGLLHQRWQCEHGIPGWVRRGLHDERLALEVAARTLDEPVERHLPFARARERHGHALGDEDAARQHDKKRLFAVGRPASRAGGEIAERLGTVDHLHGEDNRLRFTGREIEGQFTRAVDETVPRVVGPGVGQGERHAAAESTGRPVAHLHRNLHDVPFAEKSGHDRFHHQVFCRHAAIDDRSAAKRGIMCESLELPGSERVRERELDREAALLVGRERWQEEGRLDEVFPRGRRGGGRWRCRRVTGPAGWPGLVGGDAG